MIFLLTHVILSARLLSGYSSAELQSFGQRLNARLLSSLSYPPALRFYRTPWNSFRIPTFTRNLEYVETVCRFSDVQPPAIAARPIARPGLADLGVVVLPSGITNPTTIIVFGMTYAHKHSFTFLPHAG
jgi:hypothetical protein